MSITVETFVEIDRPFAPHLEIFREGEIVQLLVTPSCNRHFKRGDLCVVIKSLSGDAGKKNGVSMTSSHSVTVQKGSKTLAINSYYFARTGLQLLAEGDPQ